MSSHLLWITDPWNTLDHSQDTTLRFAQEAYEKGIPQFWCNVKTIRLENAKVLLDVKSILAIGPKRDSDSFQWGPTLTRSPQDFTRLHYRTDPPVNSAYLHPLQMLAFDLRNRKNIEMVNPLEVLFSSNEKIETAALAELMPPSLVSSDWERLMAFGKKEEVTVLKPLHQAQSQGIELLDWRTPDGIEDAQLKLEIAALKFSSPVMLQRYLPGIANGEVRLWFLDGKLLAWAKKYPLNGDFRVDIDRGSQLAIHSLTEKEKAVAVKASKHLKARKIRLAAIDLIEGYVTDFNFTSPGLIPQMEALLGENLAAPIIQALMN